MKTSSLAFWDGVVLLSLVACATSAGLPGRQSEHYQSEQVAVVIRSEQGRIEEVEVHGLLGAQVLTAHGDALTSRPDGTFEVDLSKAMLAPGGPGRALAADHAAYIDSSAEPGVLARRGVRTISFDRVGEIALRARLQDGEVLILNRSTGREPASEPVHHPAFRESVGSLRD